MSKSQKRASKKIWILGVFAVFIAIAMSFVSWLIYAVFEENYREIKQQYYAVVSYQIVEDIENSVKNVYGISVAFPNVYRGVFYVIKHIRHSNTFSKKYVITNYITNSPANQL